MKVEGNIRFFPLFRNPKHVYRFSSLMERVSSFKLGLSAASLFGVVVLTLAVKDAKSRSGSLRWSSGRENSSEYPWLVPGLQNLGNSCFLNVILQALASCSLFEGFIQKIIENCESNWGGEQYECLPLAYALAALVKDLHVACDGRVTLSPRKVMLAMNLYIPNFNLTAQQDAEEAFLHLLSSLREEFSKCYVPKHNFLPDISSFTNRIIQTKGREEPPSEQSQWHQCFLGPFDGILCSVLTCRSCSSQISLDYESFHSLPLPLMFETFGCTLEGCLKRFTAAEQVENYHCSHCWHSAAIKYMSSTGGIKPAIEMLRCCSQQDFCHCKNMFHLEALPWSNNVSHTNKQLAIARCPKILCFHLQRASINEFGEPIKVQGHVSFPLMLDLLPFMSSGVGANEQEENLPKGKAKNQYELAFLNMQPDEGMINCLPGLARQNIIPVNHLIRDPSMTRGCSGRKHEDLHMQTSVKGSERGGGMYHLVSVVEHSGRAGSGHYSVYRGVRDDDGEAMKQWFCISDCQVHRVSEEDVVAAEAALLFYQRG